MLAAKNNHTDVLEMLIEQQADLATTCNMSYVVSLAIQTDLPLAVCAAFAQMSQTAVCCDMIAWVA